MSHTPAAVQKNQFFIHRVRNSISYKQETAQDRTFLIGALAVFTVLVRAVFAFVSKQKVANADREIRHHKNTLATDKPAHGKPADV